MLNCITINDVEVVELIFNCIINDITIASENVGK